MAIQVKICGLTTEQTLHAALRHGAAYVGMVFYAASPRALDPQVAGHLAQLVPETVKKVGVFVNPDDKILQAAGVAANLDILQLHGEETPARVAEIRAHTGKVVMKAIKISGPGDVDAATQYFGVTDMLLFDAKLPATTEGLPGGNGLVFDWELLAAQNWPVPWMLSGGLHAGNLAQAVKISGAAMVDVSSGVEDKPGVKSASKIQKFLAAAERLEPTTGHAPNPESTVNA